MKHIPISLIFFAIFTSNPATAQYISYETCLDIAQNLNQRLPFQIDETTIATSSACFRERTGSKLTYFYTVTGDGRNRLGADQTQMTINTFCTQAGTRKLLKELVAVEFRYFDEVGRHLKTFKFNESAC